MEWLFVEGVLQVDRLLLSIVIFVVLAAGLQIVRVISRTERGRLILMGQDALFNAVASFIVNAEALWRNADFDPALKERADEAGRDYRLQWVYERVEEYRAQYLPWFPVTADYLISLIEDAVNEADSFRK